MEIPMVPNVGASDSNIVKVRDDRYYHHRHHDRRGWHNGYRGRHGPRPGYRRHSDGLWYPFAAFAAGAIFGGAMNRVPPPRARYLSVRHVRWCENHYRTYRRSDDTYVPRIGVRARCVSPFDR